MKHTYASLAAALLIAAGSAASISAQTVATIREQPAVISEYLPETSTLVVRAPESETPIRYRYTKTTTFTDPDGRILSSEEVQASRPATIYYSQIGDEMVATRVVLRPVVVAAPQVIQETTTTTTTTRRVDD